MFVSYKCIHFRSSHQQCFQHHLDANDLVTVWLESTGTNDCIQETDWRYKPMPLIAGCVLLKKVIMSLHL